MSTLPDNDPFVHVSTRNPIKSNGILANWSAIPPDEMSQCKRLGVRASAMVAQYARENPQRLIVTPHPIICSMEFALVHLTRPLRLGDLEKADDLTFKAEYLMIAQHIDRENSRWNSAIPLKFYDTRLRTLRNWLTVSPRRQS